MARRFPRLVVSTALAALLAACASDEEFRRADEAACAGYGFKQGSDAFSACLQRESLTRRSVGPGVYGWYGAGFYSGPLLGTW
jgi:hypothetical protein